MNPIDALKALASGGIELLEAIADAQLSRVDLVALGQPSSIAGKWLALTDIYVGKTRAIKKQRACREAARSAGMSIAGLMVVERNVGKLLDGDTWALRQELCSLTGTVDDIAREAADIVRRRNEQVPNADEHTRKKRALKGGKNTDASGLRHITISLPERTMANIHANLLATAQKLRKASPTLTYEQAMADAFVHHMSSTPTNGERPVTPLVVISLGEWAKLHNHAGSESYFALSDGTMMTGAQLVKQLMADHHLVGIWDPVDGPVNLYRSRRLANDKQRTLLRGSSILCDWPGCTTPADECQPHHLTAYSQGGETNLNNLVMLCPTHNGRNDDNPQAPPRHGRMVKGDAGAIVHIPPDGRPPEINRHPIRRMTARALALDS
ncbi:HNH endonuclease signature motif containing protein [Corynebacterium tapiri]|uniref:HNH endonuclease n=1 Tax=Corynebacterium tapiri TaxID=1448266 RepID=A0A5C4U6S6_9CORY|nr:HNH endonuclease signature motif containing protein [Corynebacterium tapiri]TNM00479.1 HNH endonuclease [Corynebacterium tapiri]